MFERLETFQQESEILDICIEPLRCVLSNQLYKIRLPSSIILILMQHKALLCELRYSCSLLRIFSDFADSFHFNDESDSFLRNVGSCKSHTELIPEDDILHILVLNNMVKVLGNKAACLVCHSLTADR
jgi:hypothetical protein